MTLRTPPLRLAAWLPVALAAALLAGCATPMSAPTARAPGLPPVRQATPVAAQEPTDPVDAAASTPSVSVSQGAAPVDNRDAIGAPVDPVNPEQTVVMGEEAKRDLWDRIRGGFAMPDLATDIVTERQQWYAGQPDYIERMSTRGGRYLFHIVEELERRNMPTELALLPFVESAFNPIAISSAKAQGLWQFMPATGRTFKLKQNLFRDERRDVLESTRAAMDYLQRLHGMFNDWHLALAAYNWGEGNVQRAIRRNEAAGLATDYASLRMPAETRHYVPKLQALKNIVAKPDAFGIDLVELPNHPYFVSVPIQRDIDVALAARLAGLSVDEFRNLNPSQKKPVILASGTPQVLLPYDNASHFRDSLARHTGPLASYTAWVVPKTMKTRDAASRVDMDESDLRSLNNIPPKMLVKAGSTLLVERSRQLSHDVSEEVADNASLGLSPDLPPVRRVSLRAGRSDSVASVARQYRLSPSLVAKWNGVGARAKFKRGQAIVVWVPQGTRVAAAAASKGAKESPAMVRTVVVDKRGRKKVVMVAAAAPSPAASGKGRPNSKTVIAGRGAPSAKLAKLTKSVKPAAATSRVAKNSKPAEKRAAAVDKKGRKVAATGRGTPRLKRRT